MTFVTMFLENLHFAVIARNEAILPIDGYSPHCERLLHSSQRLIKLVVIFNS